MHRIILRFMALLVIFAFAFCCAQAEETYVFTQESNSIKTQHDNGFYIVETIEPNDPHYGWRLGEFYIRGYNSITRDEEDVPVVLINGEDQAFLGFSLLQDLDKLNGRSDLRVNTDGSGYDAEFGVQIDRFGRGCLIIQRMDSDGKLETAVRTDYLAYVAENEANALIPLKEGNYKIALDYELSSGSLFPGYNDYKIAFRFKIQNSNNHYATILGIDLTQMQTIIIISTIAFLLILCLVFYLIRRKRSAQVFDAEYYYNNTVDSDSADKNDIISKNVIVSSKRASKMSPGTKKKIFVVALLVVAILCIMVVRPWLSRPTTYLGPITYLDEKSGTAALLATGATGLSIIITALPGDMGTPTANELSKVSSLLFAVTCLIFAEKYFITIIGFAASTIFIPLACLLMAVCILWNNEYRKKLAEWSIRLLLFGICIVLIIPVGCACGRAVEAIDQEIIENARRSAEQTNSYLADANISLNEKNEVKVESAMADLVNKNGIVQWISDAFNNFKNEAAKMLITSILIPVLMLVAFIMAIKGLLKKDYSRSVLNFTGKFTNRASKQIVGIGKMVAEQRELHRKKPEE